MGKEGNKELFRVTINNFSEYVTKTNKVRPKPYIEGKCRLPIKYQGDDYEWRKIKYWGKIISARFHKDADMKDFLVSNSKTANKPREVKVNGQEVYNQRGGAFSRMVMRDILHSYFEEHFKNIKPIEDIEVYPIGLWIKFHIHDMGKRNIDNDNKWPWRKWAQDTLVDLKIIPDDNVNIINDNRETTYLIPDDQEQKLEIIVYSNAE